MFKPHTPTKNTKQLAHSPAPGHDFLLKGESLLRKSSPITKPVATTEPTSKTNTSHVSFASDTNFGDEEELSYEEYSEEEGEGDLDIEEEEDGEGDEEEGTELNEDDFVEHLAQLRKEHALRLLELEDLYAARANYSLPNSPRVAAVHTHAPHCSEDMDYYGDEGEDFAEMIIDDPSPFPAPTAPKWKPKVTIPKPFSFENRQNLKAQERHAEMKFQQDLASPKRRSKSFHARPVPPSTKLALYNEMQQQYEQRKTRYISKSIIKKVPKPPPEPEPQKPPEELTDFKFKANPIPKSVYEPVYKQLQDKERHRKKRIEQQAKELLQLASPPSTANVRPESKRKKMTGEELSFKPQIHDVPDFKSLHQQWQESLAVRKEAMKSALSQSQRSAAEFNLKTSEIPSNKDKILEDIHRDENELIENRWPYVSKRGKPATPQPAYLLQEAKTRSTVAAELKKQMAHKRLTSSDSQLDPERRAKQKQMARMLAMKLPPSADNSRLVAAKVKELKRQQKQEEEQYKAELAERLKKIEQERPFLFERVGLNEAKHKALKRVDEILSGAGLSPEQFRYKPNTSSPDVQKLTQISDDDDDSDEEEEEDEEGEYSEADFEEEDG